MGRRADDVARLRLPADRLAVLADPTDDLLVVRRAARERGQAGRAVGVDERRAERRVAVAERTARRRGVELAVGEQLVELVPAPDLPGVDRLQRAGGPDEQRLVVVAAEHVERVGRRDGDLRLLLGGGEDRLDGEAELLRGLLGDVRSRELDTEREHAQRPGELAARRRLGRGGTGQRTGSSCGGDADGPPLEELSARQARRLPPLLEVPSAEIRTGLELLRVLEGIVLNLSAHLLSFPPRDGEGSTSTGCRSRGVVSRRPMYTTCDHTASTPSARRPEGRASGQHGGCGMPIASPRAPVSRPASRKST